MKTEKQRNVTLAGLLFDTRDELDLSQWEKNNKKGPV
jgi:hypothetical protein